MIGATLELVVLGALGKQAEQTMESKPVTSMPPWPLHLSLLAGSCLEFLLAVHSDGV